MRSASTQLEVSGRRQWSCRRPPALCKSTSSAMRAVSLKQLQLLTKHNTAQVWLPRTPFGMRYNHYFGSMRNFHKLRELHKSAQSCSNAGGPGAQRRISAARSACSPEGTAGVARTTADSRGGAPPTTTAVSCRARKQHRWPPTRLRRADNSRAPERASLELGPHVAHGTVRLGPALWGGSVSLAFVFPS